MLSANWTRSYDPIVLVVAYNPMVLVVAYDPIVLVVAFVVSMDRLTLKQYDRVHVGTYIQF